jgi:predicted dienelactone hydrolase
MMYLSRNHDLRIRSQEMEAVYSALMQGSLLKSIFPEVSDLMVREVHFAGHSFGGATCLETLANLT